MRPFRFRLAAGLLVRRKEEDAVRQRLAETRIAHDRIEQQTRAAARGASEAASAAQAARREGATGWQIQWHQSWIARKRLEADAGRRAAAVSAASVDRATAAVRVAHQRRRALERLRDRAWRRYQVEARRTDSRTMNELATLRYLALATSSGETDDDD
jgi:flagellar export protein FliJ